MTDESPAGRALIAGRWLRWSVERARDAYDRGLWVRETGATLAAKLRK